MNLNVGDKGLLAKLAPLPEYITVEEWLHIEGEIKKIQLEKNVVGSDILKYLQDIDPAYLVIIFSHKFLGLKEIFDEVLNVADLEILVNILAQISDSPFEENKSQILVSACKINFLQQIVSHMNAISSQDNLILTNILNYLNNAIVFLKNIAQIMPPILHQFYEYVLLDIIKSIDIIEKKTGASFEKGKNNLSLIRKKFAEKDFSSSIDDELFRNISLVPTYKDLTGGSKSVLEPNIVIGPYRNCEHYLSVQFQLLREDFMNPLREAISQFKILEETGERSHVGSVRVYREVTVISMEELTMDGIACRISFDPHKKMINFNWSQSKRLMQGSLLCFSNDSFDTIIFATVLRRYPADVEKGELLVTFCDFQDIPSEFSSKAYVMLESEVYFEPYYQIMKTLKNINDDKFPMYNYIVGVQSWNDPPNYILKSDEYKEILNDSSWPNAAALMLDESQHLAYKMALTNEFSVIQGPPGTGKTYLGLRITSTLLKNCKVWNNEKYFTPILIVCYTNHALDQFLEGLLPVTKLIVRVGGQSKSESLLKFNLREKRRVLCRKKLREPVVINTSREIFRLKTLIGTVKEKISLIEEQQGIISVLTLKHIFQGSVQHIEVCDERFLAWLRGEDAPESISTFLPSYNTLDGPFTGGIHDKVDFEGLLANFKFALNFTNLTDDVIYYQNQITKTLAMTENQDISTYESVTRVGVLENHIMFTEQKLEHFKSCLTNMTDPDLDTVADIYSGLNPWVLPSEERWQLYCYWIKVLTQYLKDKLMELTSNFKKETEKYREMLLIEDLKVMRSALVVGMTTTGAAKFQPVLQALKSKIVIVEEAAEVMEAHVIASLTPYCEHLILIGDHQQLRPTTANYELARNFNFNISLFERMLKNGMHYEVLRVQHRMRPEIARLISPSIYKTLENHDSVHLYGNVVGVAKNMFFVTHHQPDEEVKHSLSRRNVYEAQFTIALYEYLLEQGHSPEAMTILTTYSGQMYYLKKLALAKKVRGASIRVVDEFQGEENDIILLSLVRSNKEGLIGFLNIENRVCVALSRAKKGLFIIGNLDILMKGSKVWKNIEHSINQLDCIGNGLPIKCQVHADQVRLAIKASDFKELAPHGGCLQLCNGNLSCGHKCQKTCHIQDRDHVNYRCQEPCRRNLINCTHGHMCTKLCCEPCDTCVMPLDKCLPCGHQGHVEYSTDRRSYKCEFFVSSEIPECGHFVQRPCHMSLQTFSCPRKCDVLLKCGHRCSLKCHVNNDPYHIQYKCTMPCNKSNASCISNPVHMCTRSCSEPCGLCMVKVMKALPNCNHVHMVECSLDPAIVKCKYKCDRILPCGHPCTKLCYKKCGKCIVEVSKVIPDCGHQIVTKCYEHPDGKLCDKPCTKLLNCGHQCVAKCNELCTAQCSQLVSSDTTPACGHNITLPCYINQRGLVSDAEDLLSHCTFPCEQKLPCGHFCRGTCGQCLQGRIHKPCQEKCTRLLICGHNCSVSCAEACPPCNQPCVYKCPHIQCTRKCGQPCVECQEPCNSSCIHEQCTKPCNKNCDRSACNVSCDNVLDCGHSCMGFCGEPCPPLCGVCDQKQVTVLLTYNKQKRNKCNKRFVLLNDCKHSVPAFSSSVKTGIYLKICPLCATPVVTTERYRNETKKFFEYVHKIRTHLFDTLNTINTSQGQLIVKMMEIKPQGKSYEPSFYKSFHTTLLSRLHQVQGNWKSDLAHVDMETLYIKFQILKKIWDVMQQIGCELSEKQLQIIHKQSNFILKAVNNCERIPFQQLRDINMEVKRWLSIVQLCIMDSTPTFQEAVNERKMTDQNVRKIMFDIRSLHDRYFDMEKELNCMCKEALVTVPVVLYNSGKDIVAIPPFNRQYWEKNCK